MGVEKAGPKGYEYQYLCTVFAALHYHSRQPLSAIDIEHIGSEDFRLTIKEACHLTYRVIEGQCKQRNSALSLDEYADFLCHFESKRADTNVLSKLADDELVQFLLICSNRAQDFATDLSILADPLTFQARSATKITNVSRKKLTSAVARVPTDLKTLAVKRRQFNQAMAARLNKDPALLTRILGQLLILDDLTEQGVEERIKALLGRHFLVPSVDHERIIRQLEKIIRQGRDSGSNIIADMEALLKRYYSPCPELLPHYIARDRENELLQQLQKQRLLLLTGASFCGKSQLAKSITRQLYAIDNFTYHYCSTIEDASRFLNDYSNDQQLCLLEDPFGQEYSPSSGDAHARLLNLLDNLSTLRARFLVITSNIQTVKKISPGLISGAHQWLDCTVTDRGFVQKCWDGLVERTPGLPARLDKLVQRVLQVDPPDTLLQPGELSFLAGNFKQLPSFSKESVRHFSRTNSTAAAQMMSGLGTDMIDLLLQFGLTATTSSGPTLQDISYMLGTGPDILPGLLSREEPSIALTVIGPGTPDVRVKEYPVLQPLVQTYKDALANLEDRQFVQPSKGGYQFTHPVYWEAARQLFKNKTRFARLLAIAEKGIGALHIPVAVNSLHALYVLVDYHRDNPEHVNAIAAVVQKALSHTFVVVRNVAFEWLLKSLDILEPEVQEKMTERILSRYDHGNYYFWHNGQPYLPDVRHVSVGPEQSLHFPNTTQTKKVLNKLHRDPHSLSAEEAYRITRYFHFKQKSKRGLKVDAQDLLSLYYRQETFIREQAAFFLGTLLREENLDDLLSLFSEEHPFVLFSFLKGAIQSYPSFQNETALRLKTLIVTAFDQRHVVYRSIPLMTEFNAGYGGHGYDLDRLSDGQRLKMWEIWFALLPVFFRHVPRYFHFNTGRFQQAILQSEAAAISLQWPALETWWSWMLIHLKKAVYVSSVSEAFIELLATRFSRLTSHQREELMKQTLGVRHVLFRARLLRFYLDGWDDLSDAEKSILMVFTRKAKGLFPSIILTAAKPPLSLQHILLNGKALPDNVLGYPEFFPPPLFEQCMAVLYGETELYDLPLGARRQWAVLLPIFLSQPESPLFPLALRTFLSEQLFDRRLPKDIWPEGTVVLKDLLSRKNQRLEQMIFDYLLEELLTMNWSQSDPVWTGFFLHAKENDKAHYADQLVSVIEGISYNHNLECLPDDFLKQYIFPRLPADEMVWILLDQAKKIPALSDSVRKPIDQLTEQRAFRMLATIDYIRDWLRSFPDKENNLLYEKVQGYLKDFSATCSAQQKKWKKKNMRFLRQWIAVNYIRAY